jgi:hypothetical protein
MKYNNTHNLVSGFHIFLAPEPSCKSHSHYDDVHKDYMHTCIPFPIQITIDRKQQENVEYFNYFGSMITNGARCTREIKSRIAKTKAAFNKKKTFHQQTGLKFKEETSKVLHLEHSFVWC